MRCLTVAFILLTSVLHGQSPREIIDRYLDTVSSGSIDNWNRIKSLYTESEVYYSQSSFDGEVDLLRPDKAHYHKNFRILPFSQRNEIYADSTFSELLSTFYFLKNKTIIHMRNVPPMIKPAPIRDKYVSAHLPVQIWKLAKEASSIELSRLKEFPLDGVWCYEITITTDGRKYVLYINTETFLLEYWNGRKDEDLSMLAKFYDYTKMDEFLIPMSTSAMKDGNIYFSSRTFKYIINADIDPEVFKYKDGK